MKLSELKERVQDFIYAAYEDSIGLDGHFTVSELKLIIQYMEEYKEGNEDL